ncbi:MAG: hypothetical protein II453_14195, partial [Alphaproteobacteria bacterium]|nr:hypothetical protein [Alphaproteobacteria bacterium]
MDRLVTFGSIKKNRFIAFLDIMGIKKLLKTEGVDMVYALYAEIDDITKVYREDLIITYYSDSIMAKNVVGDGDFFVRCVEKASAERKTPLDDAY